MRYNAPSIVRIVGRIVAKRHDLLGKKLSFHLQDYNYPCAYEGQDLLSGDIRFIQTIVDNLHVKTTPCRARIVSGYGRSALPRQERQPHALRGELPPRPTAPVRSFPLPTLRRACECCPQDPRECGRRSQRPSCLRQIETVQRRKPTRRRLPAKAPSPVPY